MKKKSEKPESPDKLKVTFPDEEKGKVIIFPQSRILHPENTRLNPTFIGVECLDINLSPEPNKQVSDTLERIIPFILERLESEGVNITGDKDSLKDASFFVEAFRSLLYKYHKIAHPFQPIADTIFVLTPTGELNNSASKQVLLNIIKEKPKKEKKS